MHSEQASQWSDVALEVHKLLDIHTQGGSYTIPRKVHRLQPCHAPMIHPSYRHPQPRWILHDAQEGALSKALNLLLLTVYFFTIFYNLHSCKKAIHLKRINTSIQQYIYIYSKRIAIFSKQIITLIQ